MDSDGCLPLHRYWPCFICYEQLNLVDFCLDVSGKTSLPSKFCLFCFLTRTTFTTLLLLIISLNNIINLKVESRNLFRCFGVIDLRKYVVQFLSGSKISAVFVSSPPRELEGPRISQSGFKCVEHSRLCINVYVDSLHCLIYTYSHI